MANLSITGQWPVEIDHAFGITIATVSIRRTVPNKEMGGAFGIFGIAKGLGAPEISLMFGVPATGPEFPVRNLSTGKHTISLTIAPGIKKMALGCELIGEDYSNDPTSGTATVTLTFKGTDFLDN